VGNIRVPKIRDSTPTISDIAIIPPRLESYGPGGTTDAKSGGVYARKREESPGYSQGENATIVGTTSETEEFGAIDYSLGTTATQWSEF
jgi:hypothetical protein